MPIWLKLTTKDNKSIHINMAQAFAIEPVADGTNITINAEGRPVLVVKELADEILKMMGEQSSVPQT